MNYFQILLTTLLFVLPLNGITQEPDSVILHYKLKTDGYTKIILKGVNEGSTDTILIYEWNEGDPVPENIYITKELDYRFVLTVIRYTERQILWMSDIFTNISLSAINKNHIRRKFKKDVNYYSADGRIRDSHNRTKANLIKFKKILN